MIWLQPGGPSPLPPAGARRSGRLWLMDPGTATQWIEQYKYHTQKSNDHEHEQHIGTTQGTQTGRHGRHVPDLPGTTDGTAPRTACPAGHAGRGGTWPPAQLPHRTLRENSQAALPRTARTGDLQ